MENLDTTIATHFYTETHADSNLFKNEEITRVVSIPIVAKFEKVSYEQFKKDMIKCTGFDDEELIKCCYDDIKLPKRSTKGSAGYDFYTPITFLPLVGEGVVIPTGIRCKMEPGWVLELYPRSGQGFKYGMYLYNTVGVIDSDYYNADNEGHIMVKVAVREECSFITENERFCQGVFKQFGITIDDDAEEERTGGIGSTGEK